MAKEDNKGVNPAKMDVKEFDKLDSVQYGGASEILHCEVGEACGPLTYIGSQPMELDTGATIGHTATAEDGEVYRLPISATFLRAVDQAKLQRGDVFFVKRDPDQKKKKGKGAGTAMQIWALRVTERAETGNAVAA